MLITLSAKWNRKAFAIIVLALLLTTIPPNVFARDTTISDIPKNQFPKQVHQDLNLLRSYAENMQKTVQVIEESSLLQKGRTKDFDISEKASLNLPWGGLPP